MREVNFNLEFKQKWSNIEIEGVIAIIKNYTYSTGDTWGDVDSWAYTSSSSYAMLYYSDLRLEHDEYCTLNVDHVAITTNDMLIIVCEDEHEGRIMFELEPSDF